MKNLVKIFGIITLVVLIGFSFSTCGGGLGDYDYGDYDYTDDSITYRGYANGVLYTLKIIEDPDYRTFVPHLFDDYELIVGSKESYGYIGYIDSITSGGTTYRVFGLKPYYSEERFYVSVSSNSSTNSNSITSFEPGYVITWDTGHAPETGPLILTSSNTGGDTGGGDTGGDTGGGGTGGGTGGGDTGGGTDLIQMTLNARWERPITSFTNRVLCSWNEVPGAVTYIVNYESDDRYDGSGRVRGTGIVHNANEGISGNISLSSDFSWYIQVEAYDNHQRFDTATQTWTQRKLLGRSNVVYLEGSTTSGGGGDGGTGGVGAPLPPTGLQVTGLSSSSLNVTWLMGSGPSATSYDIHYSTSAGGPWAFYSSTPLTYAVITGLAPNTIYWVRVTAKNASGSNSSMASGRTMSGW